MSVKNRILEYFRLLRFQTSAATAVGPLIVGLVMGQRDPFLLTVLFIIGVLSHVYVFVLNEYVDVDVDKKSLDLKDKPLVSGMIPKRHALYITLLACLCIYGLTFIFFLSLVPIFFLSSSLILSGMYDIFGKKMPGSDFILAGGFFFICLFGASTVSTHITKLAYIVCLSCFLHIAFNNSIEGGLKDVDHDSSAGAKTFATRMGVKVKKGKLIVTKKFTAFAVSVKGAYIGLIVLLGFQPELNLWCSNEDIIQIITVILVVVVFVTLYKFLTLSIFERSTLKKLFSVHEIASYYLGPIVILSLIGLQYTLVLLLLPLLWYIVLNFILYGTLLQPQV